jgi:hypothetical protein
MNLWRLAVLALLAVIVGLAAGTVAMLARPRPEPESTVEAPIQLGMVPIKVGPRARLVASARRFAKVFAFVALGLLAASLASPEGFRLILEPLNVLTMFVASTIGAVLKYVSWQDVTAEAPPTVTLALAPITPTPAVEAVT